MSRPNLTNRTAQVLRKRMRINGGRLTRAIALTAAEDAALDIGFVISPGEPPDYATDVEADEEWHRQIDVAAAEALAIVKAEQ